MDPLIIVALLAFGIFILIILALVTKRNISKKADEKINSLKHLADRINISETKIHLTKIPMTKWDNYIEELEKKFQLIDGLVDIKTHFSNYEETIIQLEKLPFSQVQSSIRDIRKQVQDWKNEQERREKLINKYGEELALKIINQEYFIGMTEVQLIESKGEPTKIEQEVMKTKTKLLYIYGNKSSGDIFTFVNGELERFVDR